MFAYFRSLLIVSLIFKRMFLRYTVVYFMRQNFSYFSVFYEKRNFNLGAGNFFLCLSSSGCMHWICYKVHFVLLPFTEQGPLSVEGCISNNFSDSLLGDHCQKCSDGWYGNAKNGTPDDCRPCPCPGGPLASNQFAKTCFANETDGLPTCNNCSQGTTGRNCEMCMDGYFGRPWVSRRKNEPQIVYLKNKEALTMLCSFVK